MAEVPRAKGKFKAQTEGKDKWKGLPRADIYPCCISVEPLLLFVYLQIAGKSPVW